MDEYLCSDGIGIYQNASVGYPLSVANGRLIVGNSSNTKQVSFGCGVTVVYEEHVVRLSENGVEETIQYTQSGGDRATVTAAIDAFLASCALGPINPPTPETINALNCTGSPTPTTFPDTLERVVIVQDKPFVVCDKTPQIDIEHRTICNETTNTWHYITVVYTDGVITSNTSVDSGIPCADPLPLEPDIEQLRRCDATTSTIWIDVVRYMTNPVTNVTTSSILQSIDTLEKCNEVVISTITPEWYIGDNGHFLGYLQHDSNGNPLNWVVIDGNAPSGVNTVGAKEYGYSFTAEVTAGQTLFDFMTANGGGSFNNAKMLSLSLINEDFARDLVYTTRGASKTILYAGRLRTVEWGNGQNYGMFEKWSNEFVFQSDAEVTIAWEQVEI